MPKQPEVHFRIRNKNKEGKYSIQLHYYYNKQRCIYSTKQMIREEDWNKSKERVKDKLATTEGGDFAINDLLDNLAEICVKAHKENMKKGIPEPAVLKKAMDDFLFQNYEGYNPNKPTFFLLAEKFKSGEVKYNGRNRSKKTLGNYDATIKHLKDFELKKKYKVDYDTINREFYDAYMKYLEELPVKHNTRVKDIRIIKAIMKEAVEREETDNRNYEKSFFTAKEEEVQNVALSKEEVDTLFRFDLKNKKLEKVRDLFVFGCKVGLRFGDFSDIKKENIIIKENGDREINIITKKTGVNVIIPCDSIVIEIMEKYKNYNNSLPPSISNQKFNIYIKEVCKLAGMTKLVRIGNKKTPLYECITSHTARRSFATHYYMKKKMPLQDIMLITTHKTEKAFRKYIKANSLQASDEMRKYFD